jgi:hypothetical protein
MNRRQALSAAAWCCRDLLWSSRCTQYFGNDGVGAGRHLRRFNALVVFNCLASGTPLSLPLICLNAPIQLTLVPLLFSSLQSQLMHRVVVHTAFQEQEVMLLIFWVVFIAKNWRNDNAFLSDERWNPCVFVQSLLHTHQ